MVEHIWTFMSTRTTCTTELNKAEVKADKENSRFEALEGLVAGRAEEAVVELLLLYRLECCWQNRQAHSDDTQLGDRGRNRHTH